MKTIQELPADYSLLEKVDLQKDKKTALVVNVVAVIIMVVMAVLGNIAVPYRTLFNIDNSNEVKMLIIKMCVLIFGYIAYIILHELTHGAAMKAFGGKEVKFGFTGLYAYAGSKKDYFGKMQYLAIAMAPLIIWGLIFGVMLILVPTDWFWIIYLLQIGNVAGAAGDLFVTFKFAGLRSDSYFFDTGVSMSVFTPDGLK